MCSCTVKKINYLSLCLNFYLVSKITADFFLQSSWNSHPDLRRTDKSQISPNYLEIQNNNYTQLLKTTEHCVHFLFQEWKRDYWLYNCLRSIRRSSNIQDGEKMRVLMPHSNVPLGFQFQGLTLLVFYSGRSHFIYTVHVQVNSCPIVLVLSQVTVGVFSLLSAWCTFIS